VTVSLASWFIIALALAGANLPFFTERLFGVLPLPRFLESSPGGPQSGPSDGGTGPDDGARRGGAVKPVWLRLAELAVLYVVVGSIAWMFESSLGNRFDQGWEFFAVTGCLFIVAAYPGFVVRYLRKPSRG
jgi:hypothetical protein